MQIKIFIRQLLCLFLLLGLPMYALAEERDYIVVIDAGHGGKDPGAVGEKAKEKNINLNVALALGQLIEKNMKDTKVMYTRKTDVFVSLDRRARIANEAKADLFISIHTNALPKGRIARGTETYTLGMARADENLEVAKRENSVILVEDDYKERYAGFNPKSSESYIMFEFMQDKYMEQSVSLAKGIQGQFKSYARRVDKGVHQAGFLVLRATSMPSVLVELGYISTPDEETYLSSKKGVDALSQSIYNAFAEYKKKQCVSPAKEQMKKKEKSNERNGEKNVVESKKEKKSNAPVFKLQILTSSTELSSENSKLKGVEVGFYKENGLYKYTTGSTEDYNEILRIKKRLETKFKGAFVVAFRNGEKMNLQDAIREFQKQKK